MQWSTPNHFALKEINIDYAREVGLTGKGIGVAILDSGIGNHVDFRGKRNRVVAFKDCVNGKTAPYDDSSHGSHVAGIIGSNGVDINNNIIGVAPGCNLIAVKVLDAKGNGKVSHVINGLRWIVANKDKYNIRVVNISVGTPVKSRLDEESLLIQEVNKVWDAGLVVVVAAGNTGPDIMTITTPGISRKVITVGSWDKVKVRNDKDSAKVYSGRGPTVACIKKPDIVAPGTNIFSCNNTLRGYALKSGTSMSTPIVSGAVALLLEKEPQLTNKEVKIRLRDTATDLGENWRVMGSGRINIKKLLE